MEVHYFSHVLFIAGCIVKIILQRSAAIIILPGKFTKERDLCQTYTVSIYWMAVVKDVILRPFQAKVPSAQSIK